MLVDINNKPNLTTLTSSRESGTTGFNSVKEHKKETLELSVPYLGANTSDRSRDDHQGGAVQANHTPTANENDSSHSMKKISVAANILHREVIGITGNAPQVRISELAYNRIQRDVKENKHGMTAEKAKMMTDKVVEINEVFRDCLGRTNLSSVIESNMAQILAVGMGVVRIERISPRRLKFTTVSMLDVTPSFGSTFGEPEIHVHVALKNRELADALERADEDDIVKKEQNGKPYFDYLRDNADDMCKFTITQWPVYDQKLDIMKYWLIWWKDTEILACNKVPTLVPEYLISFINQTDNNMYGWGAIGERDKNDDLSMNEIMEDITVLVHKSAHPTTLVNSKADPQKNTEGGFTGGETIEVGDHEGIRDMVPQQSQLAALYQLLNIRQSEDINQYISDAGNKTHQTQIQRVQEEREKQTRRALLTNALRDVFIGPLHKLALYHVLESNPRLLDWSEFLPDDLTNIDANTRLSLLDLAFSNFVSEANAADSIERMTTIIQLGASMVVEPNSITNIFFDPLDVMARRFTELGLSGDFRADYRERYAKALEEARKREEELHQARLAAIQAGEKEPQ